MTSKQLKFLMALFLAALMLTAAFSAGLGAGLLIPSLTDSGGSSPSTVLELGTPAVTQHDDGTPLPPQSTEELFMPFWEAWEILHQEYVDQPLDDVQLMRGAIRGMVDSLGDPHTSYMDPDEFLQANLPLEGEYEGIGAWVDADGEFLTIISAMPGSPAERAGLLPGDEVIAVDGQDVTGMDGNLVVRMVLGPAGTPVELTLRREGSPDPIVVVITREKINLPSVESEMLPEGIGYVRLYNFGIQTVAALDQALRDFQRSDARGIVLDLRGNGGGFLDAAVEVASQFLTGGTVLIERFGDGQERIYEVQGGGRATDIPLVVLIDAGTASASEIVAGAIQDYGRGILIGETTFGKGSVQNWVALQGDQGAVRVTIARWYTPNDRLIHEVGLTPDIVVPAADPDTPAGTDPQLERAIEVLLSGE